MLYFVSFVWGLIMDELSGTRKEGKRLVYRLSLDSPYIVRLCQMKWADQVWA